LEIGKGANLMKMMDFYANQGSIYAQPPVIPTVAVVKPDARATFIRRTYAHLAGAIAAFIIIEAILLRTPLAPAMLNFVQASSYNWLLILGGFVVAGWLARNLALKVNSVKAQYIGLGFYILAEAVIFVPLMSLAIASRIPNILLNAAIMTGVLFAGLTTVVFTTKKDFSFLKSILTIGGFIALGVIICGAVFGFGLGILFSGAMVVFASAAILYDTHKIINYYLPNQHVAASLELFASIALLFWYILSIFLSRS
jgi:FtsH-binding integral membrane protein